METLEELDDGTIDWGQFDNDGPDGIPNSGDDDGFVDVLAVMHPTPGLASCSREPETETFKAGSSGSDRLVGFDRRKC